MEEMLKDEAGKYEKSSIRFTEHGYPLLPHKKMEDFSYILETVARHPNREYFIFKSIILNNLYGVDIMEEAVEICKLRLFLKLAAQVDPDPRKPNFGIEPLPDIDFNIRAGNTLVGFARYEDVENVVKSKLDFDNAMEKITTKAADLQQAFDRFREFQTEGDGTVPPEHKKEIQERLKALEEELNHYLAGEYKVDAKREKDYAHWLKTHQPFHWFIEFYGIVHEKGGFDVIIGNPPYVEYSKVKSQYTIKGYQTESCGNLYAFVVERNNSLLIKQGYTSMIIPHSAICTDRMDQLINLLCNSVMWVSTYDIRPAKLFIGVDQRLSIYFKKNVEELAIYCTKYYRWNEETRNQLFTQIQYIGVNNFVFNNSLPKVGKNIELSILNKLRMTKLLLKLHGQAHLCFHNTPRYWIRAMTFVPYFWNERGGKQISSHIKSLNVETESDISTVVAALNSSLFYWWFIVFSNCRDLVMREIESFPLGLDNMAEGIKIRLSELVSELMKDYKKHAIRKETTYQTTGKVIYDEFYPRKSKPIIDEIDCVLARHYGFTEEELDFIVNYDIKYRMGIGGDDSSDG